MWDMYVGHTTFLRGIWMSHMYVPHIVRHACVLKMCIFTETFGRFERLIGAGLADDKVFVLLVGRYEFASLVINTLNTANNKLFA